MKGLNAPLILATFRSVHKMSEDLIGNFRYGRLDLGKPDPGTGELDHRTPNIQ